MAEQARQNISRKPDTMDILATVNRNLSLQAIRNSRSIRSENIR